MLAIHESGAVADSFGDLDLAPHGFTPLVDATWVHHPRRNELRSTLPTGWSVVRDPELLAEWNRAHDYAGVLVSAVLERPEFVVLARHVGGALAGGAVIHGGGRPDVVGLSNAWSATSVEVDYTELLAVAAALHPGSSVTDFAQEADLGAMVAAGFTPLGPQRVWVRKPG